MSSHLKEFELPLQFVSLLRFVSLLIECRGLLNTKTRSLKFGSGSGCHLTSAVLKSHPISNRLPLPH